MFHVSKHRIYHSVAWRAFPQNDLVRPQLALPSVPAIRLMEKIKACSSLLVQSRWDPSIEPFSKYSILYTAWHRTHPPSTYNLCRSLHPRQPTNPNSTKTALRIGSVGCVVPFCGASGGTKKWWISSDWARNNDDALWAPRKIPGCN